MPRKLRGDAPCSRPLAHSPTRRRDECARARAQISIVLCYFQLCNEDYNWWWRAFLNSGAAGLYLLGYSFVYFFTQLEMVGFVPVLLYFTYMMLASLLFFLVTGTVGFLSAWAFVHVIYGAIKVD